MTIHEAAALLAAEEQGSEAYITVAISIVDAMGADACEVLPPIDYGWCVAIIHARDGTGPLQSIPTVTEFWGDRP